MHDLQKADFWKRISAYIFDAILVFTVAVGFTFLFSMILNTDSHSAIITERSTYYSELHDTDITMSEDKYNELTDEEKAKFDLATKEFNSDPDAGRAAYMVFNLTLISITFSTLIAYAILEFAVPLFFKNGQTLGKKMFGIAVMRSDGVRISAPILFIRTILGKCTIETLVPVLALVGVLFNLLGYMGLFVIIAVFITNLIMFFSTKTSSPIHDMFASTVVVDMSSQLIFDTEQDLLEYKQKLHAEAAERAEY